MTARRSIRRRGVAGSLAALVACVAFLVIVVPAPKADALPIPGLKAGECSKAATGNNYNGTNSARDLSSVFPDWINAVSYPCDYPPEVRGIRLAPTVIELVQGGQMIRRIPFDGVGPAPLSAVVAAIDDPSWIEQTAPGVIELHTAFVQAEGTSLVVAAPDVTQLRMQSGIDGVFFGGSSATALFQDVTVTSWDDALQAPSENYKVERPHVLYEDGSRLDLTNSTFQYLGSDHTAGYGVSWRVRGSTGTVTGSVFQHNFFGVYTFEAANITFRNNVFRDNVYYGADPHDDSVGLVFDHNEAYGNGSHGIIFSRYVHGSAVTNNFSHDNGGNGIMMDFHSDANVIQDNRVLNNKLEGIVSSGSADLVIKNNTIRGSVVGVRLSRHGADRVNVVGNDIADVDTGVKAYNGATAPVLTDNHIANARIAGMMLEAPGAVATGNRVGTAPIAYDVRTLTTIVGGHASATHDAVRVGETGIAVLRAAGLTSTDVGVRVEPGGVLEHHASRIDAPTPLSTGASESTTSRSHTLAFVGLLLVVLALLFEFVHWLRTRRHQPVQAPAHVWNVT